MATKIKPKKKTTARTGNGQFAGTTRSTKTMKGKGAAGASPKPASIKKPAGGLKPKGGRG